MDYQEITNSQISQIRSRLLESQGFKCAICEKDLDPKDTGNCNVDHQHLFKSEELGVNGNGLIRGVLCRDCNALEGKIWNAIHRFHSERVLGNPVEGRKDIIKRILGYWENNFQSEERILHPKEKRIERIGKSEYNRIFKFYKTLPSSYKKNGDLKDFPRFSGQWTQKLRDLKSLMEVRDF